MNIDQLKRFRQKSHFDQFMSFFTGKKTFQLFGDSKKLPAMVLENPDADKLLKRNSEGYGIYISVNETDGAGRKASNVKKVRYVFCDLDGQSPDKMMDDLPNFVVQSSIGKYHGYWRTSGDFPLAGFGGVQKAIAHRYGSDPSVCDLSRVLRVPGFYHLKKDPVKVEVVFVNMDQGELTYAECLERWPPKPVKQWSGKKTKPRTDSEFPQPAESIETLLEKYGWAWLHSNKWTREGKDHGVSGNIQDSGSFFVYTSSTVLEPNKSYDAAGLMVAYEFDGDSKRYFKHMMDKK